MSADDDPSTQAVARAATKRSRIQERVAQRLGQEPGTHVSVQRLVGIVARVVLDDALGLIPDVKTRRRIVEYFEEDLSR